MIFYSRIPILGWVKLEVPVKYACIGGTVWLMGSIEYRKCCRI